ncbi:MAG TPA: alpha/beta hydrolase, partial [Flavisolibacter sp.]|nr:alpha/beta hydrolase [Flavisolibacter sp.]
MQTKQFSYEGKNISYRTKGKGPLVILLHGFGEDGIIWQNQFDAFPEHQIIVPDLPGSGDRDGIDDMSMEGLADAIKA